MQNYRKIVFYILLVALIDLIGWLCLKFRFLNKNAYVLKKMISFNKKLSRYRPVAVI